jgi:hypothetical protein
VEKIVIDTPFIDPNVGSYARFFDGEWSKQTFKAVEKSPLKTAVDALMVAWRSANGAHMLPWLMVESLKAFAGGECRGSLRVRAGYYKQVINGISNKLADAMHYQLSVEQRASLKRAVAKIEKEAIEAQTTALAENDFDMASYWLFLTQEASEFQFSVLGTSRITYAVLFFAYEDFLANTVRTKESTYSSKDVSIKKALAKYLGQQLADFCWNDAEVELGRLVRNALAHNGGRLGPDLEKYKGRFTDVTSIDKPALRDDQFIVVDEKIQVMPGNTTYLFGVLKDRVSRIVEKVA